MEKLGLDTHYTYKKILKFCLSPVLMMIFCSIYGVVDGVFISNFDGRDAFAGANLIFPLIMLVGGSGFMFGSGGSALTSKLLGQGRKEEANKVFSMMIFFGFLLGVGLALIGYQFIDLIVDSLANLASDATPLMVEKAKSYGRILMLGQPFFIVQNIFQNYFMVDEKPKLGFLFTLAAGVANMIFDALFVGLFKWGCYGAAVATIIGYLIASVGPFIYFIKNRSGLIYIVRTHLHIRPIVKAMTNGFSDFIFNISSSIVSILYNIQLLKYIGQDGVSACGVVMYLAFIFFAIFIGIIIGMAPVIAYNYGAENHAELHNVVKKTLILVGSIAAILTCISIGLSYPLSYIFCREEELLQLTQKALIIYSFCYITGGLCIIITGTFTALNNGLISGIISVIRSLVFQVAFVFTLPLIFGADGIWWATPADDLIAFIFALILLLSFRKKYHY